MEWLILMADAGVARLHAMYLESVREDWQARAMESAAEALSALGEPPVKGVLFCDLLPGMDGKAFLTALYSAPPPAAPRLIMLSHGFSPPPYPVDALLPADIPSKELAAALTELMAKPPVMAAQFHDLFVLRAKELLAQLGMPPSLKGFHYAAELIARSVAQPEQLDRVTYEMYPQAARVFGVTPASVERCLRHAIESTWSHGNLKDLFRLFGHSIDPEKGKPTNREFLAMLRQHLASEAKKERRPLSP